MNAIKTMPEPLLRTDQLTRQIGDNLIVNHVSLEVQSGDFLALIGRSGAGKSSFLRLINRLDEPTGGTVYLDGQDYQTLAPRDLRRRVGMVMQQAYLFPGTIAANLRFGPAQRGETFDNAAIDALLDEVGLKGFADRDVLNLSGGEAQRVSLARTLANHPEVLLLDEPTSALDARAAHEIEALLTRIIRDQQLTTLMITHDGAQAERIASRAVLIDAGKLILAGSVKEVLDAESSLQ